LTEGVVPKTTVLICESVIDVFVKNNVNSSAVTGEGIVRDFDCGSREVT
jgi:hypothetical protein